MNGCARRVLTSLSVTRFLIPGCASVKEMRNTLFAERKATLVSRMMLTVLMAVTVAGRAEDNVLGPSHQTNRLPDFGASALGFTTQVQIADENSTGYIPVKIIFNSLGTVTADRRLIYRFQTSPGGQTPPRNGLAIDVPITVGQGSRSESFIRYLPKWSAGQAIEVSIIEDGRVLEGYVALVGMAIRRGRRAPRDLLSVEHEVNWVFISSRDDVSPKTMPDLRGIVPSYYSNRIPSELADDASFYWSQVMNGPHLLALGQNDLPHDWRAYQRYDAIVIDTKGLQRLPTSGPGFQAVRSWVLNGGTIVIYDAESPESVLNALNFRWTKDAEAAETIRSITSEIDDQLSEQIWMQGAGAGNVVGILNSDRYAVPPAGHWQIVARAIDYRASPMLRRGVDPLIGDRRFANWVIPGVAQPPVYTFMGLLTAFVVLVGPVAYRQTAKHGRSYLMFAIAPVLALFTTLAMFGYGIMSDGFGTVVRARQLTWVDGKSGDAGERIRTTYFAGVRPEGGLRFPGDAEVIGYPEGVGQSWEDLNRLPPATIGKVLIEAGSQNFDSSFLPSRQQRQFVVHAPRKNVGSIRLIPDPDAIMSPRADSTFDFLIREAVMRDRDGAYWFVENLAAGENLSCKPLTTKDASKILGRIYTDHRPLSKVRETRTGNRYSNETFDVLANVQRRLGARTTVPDGVFEQWLRVHLQTSGEIPHNHFVAIADVSPDVVSVEGSELVESVRYVFGTLR